MRNVSTIVASLLCSVLVFAACSDTVAPERDVRGQYTGLWSILVESQTTGIDTTFQCPGNVVISASQPQPSTFDGSYLIKAESDCSTGSPVSGAVTEGNYRPADGGVDFVMKVPASNTTVFQDVFPGSGLELNLASGLLTGSCVITQTDARMIGAVTGATLTGEISALVTCTREIVKEDGTTETVQDSQIISIGFRGQA